MYTEYSDILNHILWYAACMPNIYYVCENVKAIPIYEYEILKEYLWNTK